MGYTTNFTGSFKLNKQLTLDDYNYLKHLGEDYDFDNIEEPHPRGFLQWVPTEDGKGIAWNGDEKFCYYNEWLQWLMDTILHPRGYGLYGTVQYQGEEFGDLGEIVVEDGKVFLEKFRTENKNIKALVKKWMDDGSDEDDACFYLEEIAKKLFKA